MPKITSIQKKEEMFKNMTCLPQYSYLSSIEIVWNELDKRIRRQYRKSESELFSVEECLRRSTIFFTKLLERISRISKAVMKAFSGFY